MHRSDSVGIKDFHDLRLFRAATHTGIYWEYWDILGFFSYWDLYWDTAVFSNPYWDILGYTHLRQVNFNIFFNHGG